MTDTSKDGGAEAEATSSPSDAPSPSAEAPAEAEDQAAEEVEEEEQPRDPLEEARAEAAQFKEKLIRMAADFDNFRKRSRREVTEAEKKGRDGLLKDLLPVFDNLERATSHAEGTENSGDQASIKGLVDGIQLVMRQFRDALGRLGVERIESIGQPFDPAVHEAIQHLETSDYPPGCIAAEVQPGYREGERLVRPAMVVVAKAPQTPAKDEEEESSPEESTDA